MRRLWIGSGFFVLLTFALTLSTPAVARRSRKDKQMAKLVKKAKAQFEKQQYSEAADTLIKAYDLKPLPKLLYNIGRAYDKKGDSEQALRFYQRYIDADDTDAELVRNAASRLAAIREDKARAEAEAQRKIEEAKRQAEAERQKLEAEKQRLLEEEKRRRAEAEQQRIEREERAAQASMLSLAGYGLLGLGAVSFGAGGVFGYLADQDRSAWTQTTVLVDKQQLRNSARSKALGADIAFGSGALLAAAGGGLAVIATLSAQGDEEAETAHDATIQDSGAANTTPGTAETAAADNADPEAEPEGVDADDNPPPPPPASASPEGGAP